MPDKRIQQLIIHHIPLAETLRAAGIILTASKSAEGAFFRKRDAGQQASILEEREVDYNALSSVLNAFSLHKPDSPCVIDLSIAATLVKSQNLDPAKAIQRSRVKYQGTDGVRGKIKRGEKPENSIKLLTESNIFTPALCHHLCQAVAIHRQDIENRSVLIAEDGRDAFGKREYVNAAAAGFRDMGFHVMDAGILPTPLIPVMAQMMDAPFAAAVTASHNPADQNGIKFFVKGRKLLPEPDDYAVSAHTCLLELGEATKAAVEQGKIENIDLGDEAVDFLVNAITEEERAHLKEARIVIDTAFGAFSPFVRRMVWPLGLHFEVINTEMTGENINRNSGVAYLEGKETIPEADIENEILLVRRVRELAVQGGRPVFGLALDGDGDRALLVVYDAEMKCARIIDGDRMAYHIACWLRRRGETKRKVFACTAESDLNVFSAARKAGMEDAITPVGDKWLSADPTFAENLLIGEESSGHIVMPVKADHKPGKDLIYTGNGLLSGIKCIAAILETEKSMKEMVEPFPPGLMKTFYTYYVDRHRFFRGSLVWEADKKTVSDTLVNLQQAGDLPPAATASEIDFKDDRDMLYFEVKMDSKRIGAVFTRNSGTENKIAAYARGDLEFEVELSALAVAMNRNHIEMMKDSTLPETRAGEALVRMISDSGEIALTDVGNTLENYGIQGESQVISLLFSLTKERRIKRRGDKIVYP